MQLLKPLMHALILLPLWNVGGLSDTPQTRPATPAARPDDAWRTFDPIVRATNRGVALMERYDYAAAVEAFEQAVKLAPKSIETRVNLAIATYNRCGKGDLERAEKLLDDALRDSPDEVRALYFRGITHQYSGRDEQAVVCFEKALAQGPHDACAWYLLARSKSHLGQPCRSELERAIEENPALGSAYYDLMRLAAQEGNDDQAREYQNKFTQLRQSPLCEMVVMPQYGQMGPLAHVQPMAPTQRPGVAGGELSAGKPRVLLRGFGSGSSLATARTATPHGMGTSMADVNQDGRPDIVAVLPNEDGRRTLCLLVQRPDGIFVNATSASGLADVHTAVSTAFGDYDNDGKIDLFVCCAGPNRLFRGRGNATFEDVTTRTSTAGPQLMSMSAVFLDADHDADLDLYVCNTLSDNVDAANQLLNNNANGTFTDITSGAGVPGRGKRSIMATPADLDGDRDTDLVVFHGHAPASVFFNDRHGKYHEAPICAEPVLGTFGVAQDFSGDGRGDLLVMPVMAKGGLYVSGGSGTLVPSMQFAGCLEALKTHGDSVTARVADCDLDGDLDIAVFGRAGHVLLNDGLGRFVAKPNVWPIAFTDETFAVDLTDFTGDAVPDLLRFTTEQGGTLELVPTKLTPPANWLAITPTGDRGPDKRTRSPASGFGARVELRSGLHSQTLTHTGLNGGLCQSHMPVVFGLNGAVRADYVRLTWPDGVTQCETDLTSKTMHRIKEMERRVSSCPVLFAWDGKHFAFVGDFAGVGGLGYFVAPGQYAPPQPREHVKIEPELLAPRDGFYELRVCEPMEEVAYVDRLELLAIDHPRELCVYPDERLAVTGPPPTHRLLCPANPVFPARATGPDGSDCAGRLHEADRAYAYQPELDRRFCGFCQPHALVLDFADRLTAVDPGRDVYLFLNGWIEYPYSQTTFAAAQAGVTWEPLKVECQITDGQWNVIVPDAGTPGGMGRTIAIDLTGKLPPGDCKLRLSTNLEIYFDQAFVAADRGTEDFVTHTVPLANADLHRLGFPIEYSPDGQHPTIYTYDVIEPTSSFKVPRGAYARYGPVETLLTDFDDQYVILGTGDEIAVRFDARSLPPPAKDYVRSFVLISHTYCKDMDLYTAEPDTVEPLPFREMSQYPYPASERFPNDEGSRRWQQRYNTRSRP